MFSINIFSYFIVNTITIVSTLSLQKRYKAFEYHNSLFYCLSWKITGSQICQQSRINLACTKIPITTGCNVYSSTLLPLGQLCYPRKWAMSTLLPTYNWPFYQVRDIMVIKLILCICVAETFCSHFIRFCRSWIKFGFILSNVLKRYVQVYKLVDGSNLIWEKLFECSSYITFPPNKIENVVHICHYLRMLRSLVYLIWFVS